MKIEQIAAIITNYGWTLTSSEQAVIQARQGDVTLIVLARQYTRTFGFYFLGPDMDMQYCLPENVSVGTIYGILEEQS